jgi:hypothetical protein
MARMTKANTTHGRFAVSGAPRRATHRYVRTMIVRSRLLALANELQAHLPPQMAARLDQDPPELHAPKHPSQVAFEAATATTPCNVRNGGARTAGTSRTITPDGHAIAIRGRASEREAARAEADAQAPWKAAIAFARASKRAARSASARVRHGTTASARNNPLNRETAPHAAHPRAGADAVARELMIRRLHPQSASRGNDPMQRPATALRPGDEPAPAPRPTRPSPTMRLALGSTTLAGTWDTDLRGQLDVQFGHPTPPGWRPPQASPVTGTSAVPDRGFAQRPHTT